MLTIKSNYSLQAFNTFHIDVLCKHFVEVSSTNNIREVLLSESLQGDERLVLGGGSNVLFTKDFNGVVIKNNLLGKEIIEQGDEHVLIKVGAGENWHQLVEYCVNNNYAGIENLSLIPGSVGAAPLQNIGAYGVELKDVFHELEAIHCTSGELRKISKADCHFGYRNSVFKNELKNQYIITSVTLKLSKQPSFNITYGAIATELEAMQAKPITIKEVSKAVCNIRESKLPNPNETGNAGSFFKNPVISNTQWHQLKAQYPNIAGYPETDSTTKIAAGWLIEQAGWKGKRLGNYGVYPKQALVLVNYGGAKGSDILQLSHNIQQSVWDKFHITLEKEVNVY